MNICAECVVLPNKALANFGLDDAAKRLGIANHQGCYCRDELAKVIHRNGGEQECGALNLDSSNG
jgi:hypothetical protein